MTVSVVDFDFSVILQNESDHNYMHCVISWRMSLTIFFILDGHDYKFYIMLLVYNLLPNRFDHDFLYPVTRQVWPLIGLTIMFYTILLDEFDHNFFYTTLIDEFDHNFFYYTILLDKFVHNYYTTLVDAFDPKCFFFYHIAEWVWPEVFYTTLLNKFDPRGCFALPH